MKEQFQHIFQNGYPGSDVFIDEVLKPIFSDDVITSIDIDLIDSPDKRRRADNANIFSAIHVADIDRVDSDPIALYDVTLRPGSKIEHSRVAIKQFIASEAMSFTHAFILFHYDNEAQRPWRFSYVYKERTTAATRATAKRYTYVFGKDYRSRTAVERFIALARSSKTDEDFAKAFSVEALSDEFFDRYRELYADFVQYITGKRYVKESGKWVEKTIHVPNPQLATSFEGSDKLVRDYIKKMFGRIVFLYFLQRKGWLAGNRQFMHDLFYLSELQDNFLDGVLEPLFFGVLNTRPEHRSADVASLPESDKIPYLNGGLFQQDEIDERTCIIPSDYFKRLFDFFDQYNFTIDENDPEDAEVGIDPEMLGRIFENLLEDNKDKGAFYTPKEIVEYMCRESIIAYLLNGIPERSHELIRNFVETLDADTLNDEQRKYLAKKLVDVKICDPAIGSGAFPMGIVNILSKIYLALGLVRDRSKMKRHIMEQNIYGVDIEKGAVDIARLRFWLAMVVDAKDPEPLPNLHFKIMQGNSLLESYNGKDLSRLTKVNIGEPGSLGLQNEDAELLISSLANYYSESDHGKRAKIFNDIINNVRRQIHELTQSEEFMTDIRDVSATDKFFLWHTWFADVFTKGGFDIVIGNPPYIDSETMTNSQPEIRTLYARLFKFAKGNWDIYIIFYELGLSLLSPNGILSYIVPNKWLSIGYGKELRNNSYHKISAICDCRGVKVFEAGNEPIISIMKNSRSNEITIGRIKEGRKIECVAHLKKNIIDVENIGMCISPHIELIAKIKSNKGKVSDIANVENPFTTGEAYELIPIIIENPSAEDYRLINTGTIDPYTNFWGVNKTAYLKNKYMYPQVDKDKFAGKFPRRIRQVEASKIIISGMRHFESFFDINGHFVAGKSTIIVLEPKKKDALYALQGIFNSRLMKFYIYQAFSTLGIGGGINFSKDMIANLPITIDFDFSPIIRLVKSIMKYKESDPNSDISIQETEIDHIVYHLYDLTYDEVLIVDPETPITREQYDNFKFEEGAN